MIKVMTVVGTRPEIIRLSAVIKKLEQTPGIKHLLVHTGQNWDHGLSGIFFHELGLRSPDYSLEVDTTSLGATLGQILHKTESVLKAESPDAFLVLGDTNSALSAIMAKRATVPIYHMEAGNRSFDANVPEEVNRKIVDHIADFNLVYTEHARRNLLAEGIEPRRITLTGSPLKEVLSQYRATINNSRILHSLNLNSGKYFLVSIHRQENVDDINRLNELMKAIELIAETWLLPVILSVHPRTRRRMAENSISCDHRLVNFHEPFGFIDYNKLQLDAGCVLSDSGTISEESSIMGFPAITLRGAIERPEAIDTASILMVDVDPQRIIEGLRYVLNRDRQPEIPVEYEVSNTSERVVNLILSTAQQHKSWSGIR